MPKVLFAEVAQDVAEEGSAEFQGGVQRRGLGPRLHLRRLLLTMAVALATILVAAVFAFRSRAPAVVVGEGASDAIAAFVPKFEQCGGRDYLGNTCCEKGCACVIKTRFYSMCAVPEGVGSCSVAAAKKEVVRARIRAKLASSLIKSAAAKAKAAETLVGPAEEARQEAVAPLAELRSKGAKAKHAHQAAKKEFDQAKEAAEAAAKLADGKAEEYKWVKKDLDHYDEAENMNKGGQCQLLGGQCGGQIAKQMACCVIGCNCHWKNPYYGQCQAPAGKGFCDEGAWRAQAAETRANATKLEKIVHGTGKRKQETAEALAKAEEREKITHEEAIKAGTARAVAEKHAEVKRNTADKLKTEYKKLQKKADHAVHSVKYAAAMVKVWENTADGDSCSELTADDIIAADPVEFDATGGSDDDSAVNDTASDDGAAEEHLRFS